ncbi:MAG: aldehyde dehydrogenase family protein [Aggregatilineales bacterium]
MMSLPEKPYQYQMLINGQFVDAKSGERYQINSPAHEIPVGDYPLADKDDVDRAVAAARAAFDSGSWANLSGKDRAKVLLRVAEGIAQQQEELALIEVLESGKPISQSRDEMAGVVGLWEYAATLAQHTYGDSYNALGNDMMGFTLREPIGVVGMITPWNFPLLIISQKLPFALAVGCTAVIKPSELTPGTTLRLGQIMQDAGMPEGVVNIVTGYGDPVGARIADHPDVDMISFTGSTNVGKQIVRASAGNLKKVELELGGKNPQIVFDDAKLEEALDAVVFGVYFNMGECCNSGSRLLVQSGVADEFVAAVIERAKTVQIGDPLDEKTKVGAIINDAQFNKIQNYVHAGQQEGAVLEIGGDRLQSEQGRYFQATIFDNVRPTMQIAREEIFGPVLSILKFDTVEEAIHIANDTLYGLSAGIWTANVDTAFSAARRIRAGTIWINSFMDGYPELSFGGYRESGLGRELGRFAIDEFTELKTIQLHLGPRTGWWLPKS